MSRASVTGLSRAAAARIAGGAFLVGFPVYVFSNFGLRGPLMTETPDPAAAVRLVADAVPMFRLSVALDLVYAIGLIVMLSALYVVLSPAGAMVAFLASTSKFVYALTAMLVAVSLLTTLNHATDPAYATALGGAGPLEAMVRAQGQHRWDLYYVGLVFWALSSTLFSWLWLRTQLVPTALSAFGMVASAWCLVCAVAYLVLPEFASVVNVWLFDTPMVLFYLALSSWLVLRGAGAAAEVAP
jgi:hypothetical protein